MADSGRGGNARDGGAERAVYRVSRAVQAVWRRGDGPAATPSDAGATTVPDEPPSRGEEPAAPEGSLEDLLLDGVDLLGR